VSAAKAYFSAQNAVKARGFEFDHEFSAAGTTIPPGRMKTFKTQESFWRRGEIGEFVAGRAPHSFLILVLALMMSLTLRGLKHDSPTEDEWAHLVRGISYWQNHDMRIHVQHPPLANALEGLPSAFDDNPDVSQLGTWKEGYVPGLEYIKQDYAHARAELLKGRYVATLFLVALVVYLFYFCLSLFGWPTAAAVALLVAFNPTLIGQARYVATDLPVATMAAIATGELVRYLVRPIRILTLALALSALVLSKHSGVVFVGMLALIALVAAIARQGAFAAESSPVRRVARWLGHWAAAGAIVLFSINAVYRFDHTGMTVREILDTPEPQHWVTKRFKHHMLEERSPLPYLPDGLRIPLPYPYLFGLFAVREQNHMGYPTYFMGHSSQFGHWAYFPVLLALKDPPGLLVLLGLGLVIWVKTRRRPAAQLRSEPESAAAASVSPEGRDVALTGESELARSGEKLLARPPDELPASQRTGSEGPASERTGSEGPASERTGSEGPASERSEAELSLSEPLGEGANRTEPLELQPSGAPSSRWSPARERLPFGLSLASACFFAVAALFLLFIMRSHLNMGIRHGLPVITVGSVLAARAFARAGEVVSGRALVVLRLVGVSGIVSAVAVMPEYLNYYNFLALGRGSWINVVGDDWGQDREAFVQFVKQHQLEPLYYHTQTSTRKLEVDYLGLKYRELGCNTVPKPGSWAAIHVQYVRRFEHGKCARWLEGLEPEYKFHDNIWIYKIPNSPTPASTDAETP
jgi:hypothetical protein